MRWIGWAALAACVGATAAGAQGLNDARAGVAPSSRPAASSAITPNGALFSSPKDSSPQLRIAPFTPQQRRVVAPIASAAIPGSGQWMLGNNRAIAYLAVEAVAWWRYSVDVRERSLQVERFKDIARRVARAQFSPSPPDTAWVYYEMMRDYKESGQYSMTASGPVVPETDPSTFNGSRWELAQATNATYAAALADYERMAVKRDFYWSWQNAQLQFDIYTRDTGKRNDADRAATRDLIVIGANHIISMVDAFTTMRIQMRTEADGRTSIGASVRW
jgi:hypothetical protein